MAFFFPSSGYQGTGYQAGYQGVSGASQGIRVSGYIGASRSNTAEQQSRELRFAQRLICRCAGARHDAVGDVRRSDASAQPTRVLHYSRMLCWEAACAWPGAATPLKRSPACPTLRTLAFPMGEGPCTFRSCGAESRPSAWCLRNPPQASGPPVLPTDRRQLKTCDLSRR